MISDQDQEQGLINSQEMPAYLKPVRMFDCVYPENEEEREAFWDFIHWYIEYDHAILLSIPIKDYEHDFWHIDLNQAGSDSSAFNTMDYRKQHPYTFDKYQYRVKKVFEKIQDLALLHSCISNPKGKKNTFQRYKSLVEKEFSDPAKALLETYKKYPRMKNKEELVQKIAKLNIKIIHCKRIWQKHANAE
jgi:hypothetical protein